MSQTYHAGRHFLQIPGPTNVPDRVLRAIDQPDHRPSRPGVRRASAASCSPTCGAIFQTAGPVVIYPASGTGAWEAALTNTLSPGDTVLMCRTGWFATLWNEMADAARPDADLHRYRLAARRRRRRRSARRWRTTRRTASRRSASCTTKPPPAAPAASTRCARRSTRRSIRRCCWWIRSPRSPRSTTGTTSGAWTSPWPARRRG